jgi:hypothetical protein
MGLFEAGEEDKSDTLLSRGAGRHAKNIFSEEGGDKKKKGKGMFPAIKI